MARHTMTRRRRLIIGLYVPFALVLAPMTGLGLAGVTWGGWPASVVWVFACIPVVSACLALASQATG